MEVTDEIKDAKDILQNILKSKKNIRMYPQNNPIYIKTIEDTFSRFDSYFEYRDTFTIKIKQNSILYENDEIYINPEKDDNLALFFFKDGLREITFKKGLLQEELEEFLKIIALDFERDVIDDDIVTLLWEKDFHNIQYVVDESYLIDLDEEDYERKAEEKVQETVTDVDDLMKAYADGFAGEDVKTISIVNLSDKDLQMLVKELDREAKESSDKISKLIDILFEILYQAENIEDFEDVVKSLKDSIRYAMTYGNIGTILKIMKKSEEILNDTSITENAKRYLRTLPLYIGNEEIIQILCEMLDSGLEIESSLFEEYVSKIDKSAIQPFIKYLGELKTIRARRYIIDALAVIGKKDIPSLARGLDDQRWYVVRNIIYILRRIGQRSAVEHLLKAIRHNDVRVKKEVIKALGELGGTEVVQTLREFLDDPDEQIRTASAKSFANIGSEPAKKIIMDKISDKSFKDKELEEKREFFEALSKWKDTEVFDFLVSILKSSSFFGRNKLFENKAYAAYTLGIIGNKDALPILNKMKETGNKLLRDLSSAAIKKLEYGQ
jgi:HEAT repeat protein